MASDYTVQLSAMYHCPNCDVVRLPTLWSTKDIRTLTLAQCNNLRFILTLNPVKNPNKIILCPEMEGIGLYIKCPDQLKVFRAAEGHSSSGIPTVL
jgi:hypothetical protein